MQFVLGLSLLACVHGVAIPGKAINPRSISPVMMLSPNTASRKGIVPEPLVMPSRDAAAALYRSNFREDARWFIEYADLHPFDDQTIEGRLFLCTNLVFPL